jgi:methylmalonyl-CoA/ethylmalonyl-CoA epimerase
MDYEAGGAQGAASLRMKTTSRIRRRKMATADDGVVTHPAYPFELKYHHAGISVPDLESSIAWYSTMLGFEVEARNNHPHPPAKVAFLRRGELRIELFEVVDASPLPEDRRIPDKDLCTHGNKHVAYAVKDVRAAANELKSRGVDVVFVLDIAQVSVAFIRDNAGNLIELFQQPDLWK